MKQQYVGNARGTSLEVAPERSRASKTFGDRLVGYMDENKKRKEKAAADAAEMQAETKRMQQEIEAMKEAQLASERDAAERSASSSKARRARANRPLLSDVDSSTLGSGSAL